MRISWMLAALVVGCGNGSYVVYAGADAVEDSTESDTPAAADSSVEDSGAEDTHVEDVSIPTSCKDVADGTPCDLEGACNGTCKAGVCAGILVIGCDQRHRVALGASFSNNQWSEYSCPGIEDDETSPGTEVVYAFTAPDDVEVKVALKDGQEFADLFILRGCGPADCKDDVLGDDEVRTLTLAKGETVLLAVEAGMTDDGEAHTAGAYELSVRCSPDPSVCTPYCPFDAKCGPSGCTGTSCGDCDGSHVCTPEGHCEPPPDNDKCELASTLALGVSAVGTTAPAGSDYEIKPSTTCGIESGFGAGAADVVHRFTPDEDGEYVFTLYPGFHASLYVVTTCFDTSKECFAATQVPLDGAGVLPVSLVKGTTYHVIVDGQYKGAAGDYSLVVDKATGVPAGAEVLAALPATIAGNVSGSSKWEISAGTICGEAHAEPYALGPEKVYAYTPAADESVTVTLGNLKFDATVYITTFLPALGDKCLAVARSFDQQATSVSALLAKGVTYYIVVDSDLGADGTFSLALDHCVATCTEGQECGDNGCGGVCGTCALGTDCNASKKCIQGAQYNTCSQPAVLKEGAPVVGNTKGGINKFTPPASGKCSLPDWTELAPDEVALFQPNPGGAFRFTVKGTSDDSLSGVFQPGLYVLDQCVEGEDLASLCRADAKPSGGTATLVTDVAAGETVHVVVDGALGKSGTYELTVEKCVAECAGKECGDDGCGHQCGFCDGGESCNEALGLCGAPPANDACASAEAVGALPWNSSNGDTTFAKDDYQLGGAVCSTTLGSLGQGGEGSADAVYSFTLPEDGSFEVALQPADDMDAILFVATACTATTFSCKNGANESLQGGAEIVTVTGVKDETYFIIVDGAYPGNDGIYELFVTKKL